MKASAHEDHGYKGDGRGTLVAIEMRKSTSFLEREDQSSFQELFLEIHFLNCAKHQKKGNSFFWQPFSP